MGYAETEDFMQVSTHSRLKAAARWRGSLRRQYRVSTHSRLKAAASDFFAAVVWENCFNTQPPEGGCATGGGGVLFRAGFNTQPPEGGCI